MSSNTYKAGAIGVLLLAGIYPLFLHELIFVSLGIGRVIQPIEDFPYTCRRIRHERLEGCEHMWIDNDARVLYAACSSSASRAQWNPSVTKVNLTGRRPDGDYVSVLDIDEPGEDGLYGLHQMDVIGFNGPTPVDGLELHGFDVEVSGDSELNFWMINHRAPVDENQNYLDTAKVGVNSTVELFKVKRGEDRMVHEKTIASEAIYTPNSLVVSGDGGFLLTNDKSQKAGWRRELDILIGGGTVSSCGTTGCHVAATGFTYPNGIAKGKDGLYYIASSIKGFIRVMKMQPNGMLKDVDIINVGLPIDNLSVDWNGDIFAAGFPKIMQLLKSFTDPYNIECPSTLLRIRKSVSGYEVKKILEDKKATIMSGATIVQHDVKTGRLFIGGAVAPHITVCEPR